MTLPEPAESVATVLRRLLREQRISQIRVAETLGRSQQAISRRLNGDVDLTIPELDEIANLLGRTSAEILEMTHSHAVDADDLTVELAS
jgi:transcriptional regulator with XRE-family HTH domain